MSAPEPYQPEPGAIITLAGRLPREGWEAKRVGGGDEHHWAEPYTIPATAIVEARPIPKPPLMVEIPRDVAEAFAHRDWTPFTPAIAAADVIRAALAAEGES